MNEKIFDRCVKACNRYSNFITVLLVAAGAVIFLQNKKIENLNTIIAASKQPTGDQKSNA